jgi:hypothetical protein
VVFHPARSSWVGYPPLEIGMEKEDNNVILTVLGKI